MTKQIEPDIIYADHEKLRFLDGNEEVILPRINGYKPRYHDTILVTSEGEGDEKITTYTFKDVNVKDVGGKEYNASYTLFADGHVIFEQGKDEVVVSAKDMDEIRAGNVGWYFEDINLETERKTAEFASLNSKSKTAGAVVSGLAGGLGGVILYGCGEKLVEKYLNNQKKRPKEIPVNLIRREQLVR